MPEDPETDQVGSEIRVTSDPLIYETIFNIVQDAQAAGSVVQLITIWPPSSSTDPGGGTADIKSCNPKDTICPK